MLQLKGGTTQSGGADICTEVYASPLGLGPGDTFEIMLSADEHPGTGSPLGPGPGFVHVRDYYFDWLAARARDVRDRAPRHPGHSAARRSPPSGSREMLDAAAHEVEHSTVYFRDYPGPHPRRRRRRTGSAYPTSRAGRARHHLQPRRSCRCADDEALVLELDPARRRAVGVQLLQPRAGTSRSTTRPGSPAATTGRSPPTTTASCASSSPDTTPAPPTGSTPRVAPRCSPPSAGSGRPEPPHIAAEVVPLADLASHLPDGHPPSTPTTGAPRSPRRPRTSPGGTGHERRRSRSPGTSSS